MKEKAPKLKGKILHTRVAIFNRSDAELLGEEKVKSEWRAYYIDLSKIIGMRLLTDDTDPIINGKVLIDMYNSNVIIDKELDLLYDIWEKMINDVK